MALRRHVLLSLALISFLLLPTAARGQNPVLLGLYQWGDFYDLFSTIAAIDEFDTWVAPHRMALGGDFLNLEDNPWLTIPAHLGSTAWDKGRIPFIKLLSYRTAAEINNGLIDAAIAQWGQGFAQWSAGGTKRAFLAPLPEMNGSWIPYYGHSNPAGIAAVVQAYRRIRNIIRAELQAANVPQNAINWVFAPNGWSLVGDEFERYYPGHDAVDVISFSGYAWGGCPPWLVWDTFEVTFEPYLHRVRALAPGKPIFVAETAVIDNLNQPLGDRNEWLRDSYTRLAAFPALRGIVYFNFVMASQPSLPNCPNPDFRLHVPGTDLWQGFKDALNTPGARFGYWAPTSPEVANIVFAPTVPHVFDDVHPIHPFAAEPGEVDYSPWIHTLAASGITSGCNASPPLYCPTASVTRAQMAVFLLRGIHGATYNPPPATGTLFTDVPAFPPSDNPFAKWIEQLAKEGITGGCGPSIYCPGDVVTRGQMALFLLKAKYGAGYPPPNATGMFTDVPVTPPFAHPFAKWIEQLAREGITGGCGDGKFCPDASITRDQMAVFLVRAFGLAP